MRMPRRPRPRANANLVHVIRTLADELAADMPADLLAMFGMSAADVTPDEQERLGAWHDMAAEIVGQAAGWDVATLDAVPVHTLVDADDRHTPADWLVIGTRLRAAHFATPIDERARTLARYCLGGYTYKSSPRPYDAAAFVALARTLLAEEARWLLEDTDLDNLWRERIDVDRAGDMLDDYAERWSAGDDGLAST